MMMVLSVMMMPPSSDHVRHSQQTRYEKKRRQKGLRYQC
jgi:hypothetical protein